MWRRRSWPFAGPDVVRQKRYISQSHDLGQTVTISDTDKPLWTDSPHTQTMFTSSSIAFVVAPRDKHRVRTSVSATGHSLQDAAATQIFRGTAPRHLILIFACTHRLRRGRTTPTRPRKNCYDKHIGDTLNILAPLTIPRTLYIRLQYSAQQQLANYQHYSPCQDIKLTSPRAWTSRHHHHHHY